MEELWPGGIKYEGAGAFPVTTDSLLLADFARMRRGSRVLELGCAAGLISLLLLWREPELELSAVELDGAAAETALRNFAANGFAATVICGDLRARENLPEPNSCDAVVCNPPYFALGRGALSRRLASARSEGECSFSDAAAAAGCSLRQGGRFYFIHRAERLAEIFAALDTERLCPKRLRFVQHRAERAPELFLCEAARLARHGLKVEPPLVLYGADGEPGAEFKRIYHMEG